MEYNKLTKKLIAEGYDEEHFPDYVYIDGYRKSLDNHNGGFQYYYWYLAKLTFETPCGIQCRYESIMGGVYCNGAEWTYENDCPIVHCPFKGKCQKKDKKLLDLTGIGKDWCNVHQVDKPYEYEGSLEQINKLHDEDIRNQMISFKLKHNNRVCDFHMHYDHDKEEWIFNYDPMICGNMNCPSISQGKCPVIHKTDKRKGNVYYDLKTRFRRRDLDGTLFEGQIDTHIIKDKQVFKSPVNYTICQITANMCKDEILRKERLNHHSELFFSERYEGHFFDLEVINIRAETKVSRDLEQDLQDMQEGIKVSHERDIKKKDKEMKRQKRQESEEKRKIALRKKLVKVGIENFDDFSLELKHARKWFNSEELRQIRKEREEMLNQPKQISLEDYFGIKEE